MDSDDSIIYFGSWKYNSFKGELSRIYPVGSDEECVFILPESQQLILAFLIKNPQRLISKRELLSIISSASELNERYLFRQISSLRSKLGDNGKRSQYIITVRKRGFRFVGTVTCFNDILPKTYNISDVVESKIGRGLFFLFFLIVFGLVFLIFLYDYQKDIPQTNSHNLSSMPGIELYPSVSSDGKYVAYTGYVESEDRHSIFIQDIETKSITLLKSEVGSQLYGPAWFERDSSILYQKIEPTKGCEIRKIQLNPLKSGVIYDSLITFCGKYSYASHLQVTSDSRYMFYSSKDSREEKISIIKYSFENNTKQKMTSPPSSGVGDYSAAISSDGKQLAFLRDATKTHAQLWLMNLSDGRTDLLYESPEFYPVTVNWTRSDTGLLLSNQLNEINVFDLKSRKFATVAFTDQPVIQVAQLGADNFIFSGGYFWKSNFWKQNNFLVNSSTSRVRALDVENVATILKLNHIPSKPSAVLSERSGRLSLWFYYPDGRQIEFDKLAVKNHYAQGVFSPDGTKLFLLNGNQFWLIEDENRLQKFDIPQAPSQSFSWSSDGRFIFYIGSVLGQEQVFQLDIRSGASKQFSRKIRYYEEVFDGSYAVQLRHDSSFLEVLKRGKVLFSLPLIEQRFSRQKNYVLRKNGIYFYRKMDSGRYSISRFNVHLGKVEDTGVSQKIGGRGIDVSLDEQFIFTDDGMKGDIDIRTVEGIKIQTLSLND